MLKSKLERFVAKRVLIVFILMAILDIVLMNQKWHVLVGMLLGGIFSLFKFSSYAFVFSKVIASAANNDRRNPAVKRSMLIFIINQLVLLPILYVSYKFNEWFFMGIVAGILLVPLVLIINSITEPLKITHNNFE